MSSFKNLRIVDNFYQSSSFFPMPLVLVGTLDEDGNTSFGAYSLCFPYYIAGKDYYAMILECRNSSNTCKGLLRAGKCTLNFLPDDQKYFKEAVRLGFPGDTPAEKMKDFNLHMEDGLRAEEDPKGKYPKVITEALQVFECTWDSSLENAKKWKIQEEYPEGPYNNFNGITSKFGAHFILKIDKVLMKEKYHDAIINGVTKNNFPHLSTNFGYRDSKNFWSCKFRKPYVEGIPDREVDLTSVRYAADRADDKVKFTDDALQTLVKVPRVFLKLVLKGCVDWAYENNCMLITAKEMKIINDKRSKEKNKK